MAGARQGLRALRRAVPPAHVPLLAAFPALFLFSQNPGADPAHLAAILLPTVCAVYGAWMALSIPLGGYRAGLVASAGAVLFLLHGHIEAHVYLPLDAATGLFTEWEAGAAGWTGAAASVVLSAEFATLAVFAAAAAGAAKAGAGARNMSRIATAAAAGALLIPAGTLAAGAGGGGYDGEYPFKKAAGALDPGAAPDVWYILPDAYMGPEGLRETMGFDSGGFVSALEGAGLSVAGGGLSNYDYTDHVVESLLAMNYAGGDLQDRSAETFERRARVYADNEVFENFREMGYETHHIRAGVMTGDPDRPSPLGADFHLCTYGDAADSALLNTYASLTAAGQPLHALLSFEKLDKRLCVFEEISRLAAEEGGPPKFVFAHVYSPHRPYIFDAGCGAADRLLPLQSKEGYLEQVRCVNSKIAGAVADIMAPGGQPIVIVQADHGPRLREPGDYGTFMSSHNILRAYHFPGGAGAGEFEASTPVNTFRIIFDEHFGGEYGLLPDEIHMTCKASLTPELEALRFAVLERPCHAGREA